VGLQFSPGIAQAAGGEVLCLLHVSIVKAKK
jgi:hypothetical protein